jgi:hypothetical protein
LLHAARLAASKIAVRAKVDLLFVGTVDVDAGGRGGGTGVVGADVEEIEVRTTVDSFGTSLSDKLFRFRVEVECKIAEGSGIGSVECSESDRERDCLSVLIVNGFRAEERSSRSVDTNRGSDDEDR